MQAWDTGQQVVEKARWQREKQRERRRISVRDRQKDREREREKKRDKITRVRESQMLKIENQLSLRS